MANDVDATTVASAVRAPLRAFLIGVAPQWLILGASPEQVIVGACVLVAALGIVELHQRSYRRQTAYGGFLTDQELRAAAELRHDDWPVPKLEPLIHTLRSTPPPRPVRVAAYGRRLLGFLVATLVLTFLMSPYRFSSLLWFLFIGLSLLMGAVCWTTLVWMMNAWRNPGAFDETRVPIAALQTYQSFSLIVPARHEERVLAATLSRLLQTDHPDYEVLVVVGHDDAPTKEVADRVAADHPDRLRVVVDHSWPKNKPKALNSALPYCRGQIVGVFDAEDDVHPALIRRVDQCFQRTHADVVQAGVQLTNLHSSWFSLRNALEYYFWFRSRLHFHARAGFIPLGGNTVFIRTDVLREVDGWDAECLAEDCELGVRLSSFGAKTVVFYEPELVTREETPPNLGAFIRQRTRWSQGYLQTLNKGYWRLLPLKQRAFGFYTLAMPYMLAIAWIMLPAAIATAIAVTAPVPITLLLFLPALPMLVVLAVEAAGLGDLCRTCGERAVPRDYARLVIGLPIYQIALAFASARAVAREARGARGWEKTAHFGLHRADKTAHDDHVEAGAAELRVELASTMTDPRSGPTGHESRTVPAHALDARSAPYAVAVVTGHANGNGNGNGSGNGNGNGNGNGAGTDLLERTPAAPLWSRLRNGNGRGNGAGEPPTDEGHAADDTVADATPVTRRRGVLRRLRTSWPDLVVLLPLLAGVSMVQVVNVAHWPESLFDEGTYVSNAWAVGRHGALSNYTYGYGHPPLGWLLVTLWTWATGLFANVLYSVTAGRQLMVIISIVSCWLVYVLARRLNIGRPFAGTAMVLFALSPVALYFHRLVLIDNPAVFFTIAAFVLALSPRRRLWTFAASGACFAAGVLSKESMLVLLPVLFYAAARNGDSRTRRYCLTFLVSFAGLILLAYPLYATLKGELIPGPGHVSLIGEAEIQLFTRKATGSIFDPHSQTHLIVLGWLHTDVWLLGAAAVLSPIALARRSTRPLALAFLIQCALLLRPGYLPYMYVLGLLPFAAIVVAGSADALWRIVRNGTRQVVPARGRVRTVAAKAVSHLSPVARVVAAAGLALILAGSALLVGPEWAHADRQSMTVRQDGTELAAQRWLVRHMDRSKRLLVSDAFWVYLIEHGFDSHPVRGGFFSRTVIFYWTVDFDPAVQRLLPQGWKNFDYVVSTLGMRNDAGEVPQTQRALANSHVVVTFGHGLGRIEVRAVDGHVDAPLNPPRQAAKPKRT